MLLNGLCVERVMLDSVKESLQTDFRSWACIIRQICLLMTPSFIRVNWFLLFSFRRCFISGADLFYLLHNLIKFFLSLRSVPDQYAGAPCEPHVKTVSNFHLRWLHWYIWVQVKIQMNPLVPEYDFPSQSTHSGSIKGPSQILKILP